MLKTNYCSICEWMKEKVIKTHGNETTLFLKVEATRGKKPIPIIMFDRKPDVIQQLHDSFSLMVNHRSNGM